MLRIVLTLVLMAGIYTAMRGVDTPRPMTPPMTSPVTPDVQGVAHVHDADTFTVAGVKIRLFGIDAPEMDQNCTRPDGSDWACGRWSTDQVRHLLNGRDLRCVKETYDKYGRMVARCYLGEQDLAKTLVQDGVVFAYARYSSDYLADENAAQRAKRGLWQAQTMAPAEFRRQKREN